MITGTRSTLALAAMIFGALLLAEAGVAAGTTTSTLPPAPALDAVTAACVKKANVAFKACSLADCVTPYKTAVGSCFASGKGSLCGAACVGKKVPCEAAVVSALAKCQASCAGTPDPSCSTACSGQAFIDGAACKTGFTACLVKCPILGAATTTTVPSPTVTTTTIHGTTTTTRPVTTTSTTTSSTLKPVVTTTTLKPGKTTTTTTLKHGKTTTTTKPRATTTTTTLPPLPPFTAATQACVDKATAARKSCTGNPLGCQALYYSTFAGCFAPGKGIACAATCVNQDAVCEIPSLAGGVACRAACQNAWTAAGPRCRGDNVCLTATTAAFAGCASTCTHPSPVGQCRLAFATCLATCPNLPDPGVTTTTTPPPVPTTTSSTSSTSTTSSSTTSSPPRPPSTTTTLKASTTLKPSTTSSTLSASTTTTTLVTNAAFSPPTAACIKAAQSAFRLCGIGNLTATCRLDYDAALPDCFVPGNGVTRATACVTTRRTCENPAQAAEKLCSGDCIKSRTTALRQCTDAACFTSAQAGYTNCKRDCAAQAAGPLGTCKLAFDACLTHCPNL